MKYHRYKKKNFPPPCNPLYSSHSQIKNCSLTFHQKWKKKERNSNIFTGLRYRSSRFIKYPSYLKKKKFHRFFKKKKKGKRKQSPDDKIFDSTYRLRSYIRASSLRHSDETPNNKSRHGEKRKARNKRPFIPSACCSSVRRFRASRGVKAAALACLPILMQSGQSVCSLTVDREMRIFFFLFSTPGFAWPGGDFVIENGETPHAGSTRPARAHSSARIPRE